MSEPNADVIFRHEFTVPTSAIDQNGHVNNVVYVQWMQDVAVLHSDSVGGVQALGAIGAAWVVHSHKIKYLHPTFVNEEVIALTWVENFRRARSLRRYQFLRKGDNILLAEAETDWVFVNAVNGRPMKIPNEVTSLYPILVDQDEHDSPTR